MTVMITMSTEKSKAALARTCAVSFEGHYYG